MIWSSLSIGPIYAILRQILNRAAGSGPAASCEHRGGPKVRHNEGQGKVQHAPDIVRASTTEPISALRSTIGSLWSAGCAWPRDRLNPDAASRSVVDFDPRLVADAAECLRLGLQTRRARPKSFLRRPPRARKRPSEPSCCTAARRNSSWRRQTASPACP